MGENGDSMGKGGRDGESGGKWCRQGIKYPIFRPFTRKNAPFSYFCEYFCSLQALQGHFSTLSTEFSTIVVVASPTIPISHIRHFVSNTPVIMRSNSCLSASSPGQASSAISPDICSNICCVCGS